MLMKRIGTLLIACLMVFGLVACGDSNNASSSESAEPSESVSVSAETSEVASETTEETSRVSADELGINVDELMSLISSLNLQDHNFEDMDEVEKQVEMGAGLAFSTDKMEVSYSTTAYENCGIAIWSVDNYDYSEVAEKLINGDTSVKEAWDSLRDLAIDQAEMIDTWTGIELSDEDYHTVTASLNNSNPDLILLVVYNSEILYDVTENY